MLNPLRKILTAAELAAQNPEANARAMREAGGVEERDSVLGRITAATPIAGEVVRWLYDWVEAEIVGGLYFDDRVGGISGVALNVAEGANTASVVANGVDRTELLGTFDVKPASGFVELTARRSSDGTLVWTFTAFVIDGLCPMEG